MRIRLTEEQLQHIMKQPINENYINSSPESIQLANQLFNDPNNRTLWRCFYEEDEASIFKYGMSSDWFDAGEGSYHGKGVYAFYEPYGAQKRCGTGGVGNKIMKGVLRNKFRNFIILDGDMAERYYGSYDIRTQVNALYTDENFKREFLDFYKYTVGSYEVPHKRSTGYISKALFERFRMKLRTGKVRGVVYNGGQDPHACIIYNPREFIPVCVTKERRLNASGRDFDNWEVKVTQETINSINNIEDYYSYGERLKANGEILSYERGVPPFAKFLTVTLPNRRISFFDIKNKKIISKYGFDSSLGFEKFPDGTVAAACYVNLGGKQRNFYIVPYENEYYVCKLTPPSDFREIPKIPTLDTYDEYMFERGKKQLNESEFQRPVNSKIDDLKQITNLNCRFASIYHRTGSLEGCEGIAQYGFSKEFFQQGMYGVGIYAALTPWDSTNSLEYYGHYMIHAYIKDGFKDFLIFEERLAREYYGENYNIQDQLKLLARDEYRSEILSRYSGLSFDHHSSDTLKRLVDYDIGKTKIRGLIMWYSPIYAVLVCDWKSAIPYEYSYDYDSEYGHNGLRSANRMTQFKWHKMLNKENFSFIDDHQDAYYVLQPFYIDGIIQRMDKNVQFVNGYVPVTLKRNGKMSYVSKKTKQLVSQVGFDQVFGWEKSKDKNMNGMLCSPCIINGKEYVIYEDDDEYVFTRPTRDKLGNTVDKPIYLKNGDLLTVRIYDKMMHNK